MTATEEKRTGAAESREFAEMYGRYLDVSGIENKVLDVRYGEHERNILDIYYPDEKQDRYPLILFFHGGAFFKGDKRRYQLKPALEGISRGYAVASANYRLIQQAPYPSFTSDAVAALSFLKANAEQYHLDSDHICVWGESAGAYLALVTGFSEEAQTIIDWYGFTDFTNLWYANERSDELTSIWPMAHTLNEATFRCTGKELSQAMQKANAENCMKETIPAVFIEHGLKDELISFDESIRLHRMLSEKLPADRLALKLFPDGVHGVEGYSTKENLDEIFRFIQQTI